MPLRSAAFLTLVSLLAGPACRTDDGGAAARTEVRQEPASLLADTAGGILRLPPSAFPNLPGDARRALEDRGCAIPQSFADDRPHNVVRGELAAPGQLDWAALCSRRDSSRVTVVWGGPRRCDDPLPATPDRIWRQGLTEGAEMVYSRKVKILTPAEAAAAWRRRGETTPDFRHDLLDDMFLEKASTTYYCDGEWRVVGGAD